MNQPDTTMRAVEVLRERVAAVVAAEAELAAAVAARDDAVRDAIEAGVPVAQIAEVGGISRMRVYQIRDRSR